VTLCVCLFQRNRKTVQRAATPYKLTNVNDTRQSSTQQLVWSVMLWKQITLHLCWKTYTGYESRKGSSTSYVSLRSRVNIVWHHPTCPTNFNKSLEWSPDSVWYHRVRQLLRSSLGDLAFLVAAARERNSLPSTLAAASSSLHSFRRALKTHLFTASFPPSELHYLHSELT